MKIKRFNEANIFEYELSLNKFGFTDKLNMLRETIQLKITDFMRENGDEIIFDFHSEIVNPKDQDGINSVNIYGITSNATLLTSKNLQPDDIYDIEINEIVMVDDLIEVIKRIDLSVERTYEYQKNIIENNKHEIGKIMNILNARIKKEYPHLTSGKDLNLL